MGITRHDCFALNSHYKQGRTQYADGCSKEEDEHVYNDRAYLSEIAFPTAIHVDDFFTSVFDPPPTMPTALLFVPVVRIALPDPLLPLKSSPAIVLSTPPRA